ncbi:C40 family peptidase [Ferribacterium limneticum]|uniref:C40 family peptidase n=1 Tax=Ferribacterium limneticum TaxID=76259 RepID=UPI001CF86DCE|nr:C40 family peptidase [Ferribacterium limneticum]UCV26806.1 C40 family peptidase [Ferribacterium limneticum]UCV30723.1 C40 family peptidase [Ferribacterium limneticum]
MIDVRPFFEQAFKHAQETPQREACGLVVVPYGHPIYRPCRNIAETDVEFVIHPADYLKAEREGIIAVVHSHLHGSPEPSMADLVGCESTKLPWIIVALPSGAYKQIEPTDFKAPLIGRPFVPGVLDCFSLARDYYATIGLDLPDFARDGAWWEHGEDLLTPDNFWKAGFRVVTDGTLRMDDGIIMQNGITPVPNHVAVYLGDGLMLHHSGNALSCKTPYGGYWQKCTNFILRHESKC